MDRDHDLEVVVCERCGGTGEEPADQPETDACAVPVKKPPLIELTTPAGRVWYIVNPN
jgi:hypothetical protein